MLINWSLKLLLSSHQSLCDSPNYISSWIWMKLPKHDPCPPGSFLHCFGNCACQVGLIHPACIGGIEGSHWLADNYHLQGNSTSVDLLHRSVSEWSHRLNEQPFICIICVISLIIELDVVKIDQMSHLLMHSHVGSKFVMLTTKIRCLRSMSNNVSWQHLPQLLSKGYYPSLAQTLIHCWVIFPVDISTIKVIR